MSEIKQAIKKMMGNGGFSAQTSRGIVLSVNKDTVTCDVKLISSDAILHNVKLKPVISEGDTSQLGLIIYPALQSFVTVGIIDNDNNNVMATGFTVIESIALDTATALKLLITTDGKLNLNTVHTTFNDGKNGGIPLLKPLTAAILKLQQQFNSLSNAFATHVHALGEDGTIPTVTPAPKPIAPLIKTTDIENKAITQ